MQSEQRKDFDEPKGICRKHSRHGGAEKSKNETTEQTAHHDSRVSLAGIKFRDAPEIKWPERDADNSGENSSGKENAKRFFAEVLQCNSF